MMKQKQDHLKRVGVVVLLLVAGSFLAGSQYARAQAPQPRQAATIGPTAYAAIPPEISAKARLVGFQVDQGGFYRLAFQEEDGTVKLMLVTFAPGTVLTGERPILGQVHIFVPGK